MPTTYYYRKTRVGYARGGDDEELLIRHRRDMGSCLKRIEQMPRMAPRMFCYNTEKEKEAILDRMHEITRVEKGTKLRSKYEAMFRNAFSRHNGLMVLYEPVEVPVDMGNRDMKVAYYMPDFWLPHMYVDGRAIVIEPHNGMLVNSEYVRKLKRFSKQYNTHLILSCTSNFSGCGLGYRRIRDCAGEFWCIDQNSEGKAKLMAMLDALLLRAENRKESAMGKIVEALRRNVPAEWNGAGTESTGHCSPISSGTSRLLRLRR